MSVLGLPVWVSGQLQLPPGSLSHIFRLTVSIQVGPRPWKTNTHPSQDSRHTLVPAAIPSAKHTPYPSTYNVYRGTSVCVARPQAPKPLTHTHAHARARTISSYLSL